MAVNDTWLSHGYAVKACSV